MHRTSTLLSTLLLALAVPQLAAAETAQPAEPVLTVGEQDGRSPAPAPAPKPAAEAPATPPGSFKIPGTSTTLRLYGFVEVHAAYDLAGRVGNVEAYDWSSVVPFQPLDGSADAREKGRFYVTARTSRIGLDSRTPSPLGEVYARLEGDFNGVNLNQGETYSNSVLFRLNHAYVTLGSLLIGQTGSLTGENSAGPDTVDWNGPGTQNFVRQPQVRLTFDLGNGFTLAASAENAHNLGSGHLPDFTAQLAATGKWGKVTLGAITNEYRYEDGSSTPRAGSLRGFGGLATASLNIGDDNLILSAIGGQGLGRYLFNSVNQFVGTDADGKLQGWRVVGYHAAYTHRWNGQFRSNVVFSQTFLDRNGIVLDSRKEDDEAGGNFVPNRRLDQAFVNTFWHFLPNAEVGLEYEWGRRETFDKQLGRESRVTAVLHYDFL